MRFPLTLFGRTSVIFIISTRAKINLIKNSKQVTPYEIKLVLTFNVSPIYMATRGPWALVLSPIGAEHLLAVLYH